MSEQSAIPPPKQSENFARQGVLLAAGLTLALSAFGLGLGLPHFYGPFLAALAMGLQASAVQQIGVAGVSTIVVTNTLITTIRRWVGSPASPSIPPHHFLPAWSWLA
jgi:uncharacterized membrane protein YoaK (UPF0700 family)